MSSSNMDRRNSAAKARGFVSYAQQRKFGRVISRRADLAALPPAAQHSRQRALDVVSLARREGIDVGHAARRENVPLEAVTFWADDAVVRQRGLYLPTVADRLYRPMYVYSAGRPVTVEVRGSKVASMVGAYHAAMQHYLNTGDASRLLSFKGGRVGGVELETDLDVLDEMARRGSFEFESIYRMAN